MKQYLDEEMRNAFDALEADPSKQNRKKLCEITLARLVFFNKRRWGEAQRMKVEDYIKRPAWSAINNEDIQQSVV